MKNVILAAFFLIIYLSGSAQEQLTSQAIIDKAIEAHGGDHYKEASYSYTFRNHEYRYIRDKGEFTYSKYSPQTGIRDVLTNSGLTRYQGEAVIELTEKEIRKHSESVNSVHYFAFLPYFLRDPAVNHRKVGETIIKGQPYHQIEVTFDQEGGGVDFQDVYVYWIHRENYTVDYLAYSFHVNGGGVRFRSAYNKREIGGITFQDYLNHKHDKHTPVAALGDLYDRDELSVLSKIELVDIKRIKT